jgi:UDP-N-acetylmuramoyl-tripeptide--D-alanyl-D-alanine ligase
MIESTPIERIYEIFLSHPKISKDSRNIEKDCIYLAIKGDNFDGNQYAEEALEKGAAYTIVDDVEKVKSERYLYVKNTLECLQDLARFHRSKLKIPIIGITGSNGKTTTKELITAVLSKRFNCYATKGNYNNHIGVPLSLLEINEEHEIAVIEMGANHQGEIAFLSSISDPDFGLITNIGKAHLEGFGGIEGVKKGKSELYRHLKDKNGKVFLNGDDPTLIELAKYIPSKTYGIGSKHYCNGKILDEQPYLKGSWKCEEASGEFEAGIYGTYNFYNIMAAICIGHYFGVNSLKIDEAISAYQSDNNRSQLIHMGNYAILLDAYNANPSSMQASIENFAHRAGNNKLVILGDMFELGNSSEVEHFKIAQLAVNQKFEKVILVGKNFSKIKNKSLDALFFETTKEAANWFKDYPKEGSEILIKGSRGMALEKILDQL